MATTIPPPPAPPNFPNVTPHPNRHQCKGAHTWAHSQHITVLKHHFVNIQYGWGMQSTEAWKINLPQTWHNNIIRAQSYPHYPKIYTRPAQASQCKGGPYAHPQHVKELKHFVNIWYGCGMQSKGVWSLNHDITIQRLGKSTCLKHDIQHHLGSAIHPLS